MISSKDSCGPVLLDDIAASRGADTDIYGEEDVGRYLMVRKTLWRAVSMARSAFTAKTSW